MKAMGAAHLEGTVFTGTCTLMAVERSHRDRKWEHQADTGLNEGTISGSSSRTERVATLDGKEDVVTFELGETLLMLLAAGGDDNLTDFENKWDLFHDELQDFYDLDL